VKFPERPKRPENEEPPGRMIARVVMVLLGYLAFNAVGQDALAAAFMLWAGIVLVGWFVVDRFAPPSKPQRFAIPMVAIGAVLLVAGGIIAASS
jgi:hypothetical protein